MRLTSILASSLARLLAAVIPPRLLTHKQHFHLWERRGYHITPVHFYEPIPDTRTFPDAFWAGLSDLPGINLNEQNQLALLSLFAAKFADEYNAFPQTAPPTESCYFFRNPFFGSVDAEVLYCMIRHYKPRRIIEVGAGFSTYLSAQAILKNRAEDSNYECALIAIDPHPNPTLEAGFPGLTKLIATNVQEIPPSEFEALAANDILFVDSSHVLRIGGDVPHLYLDILPRLTRGVLVHVHDIFLPAQYPRTWVLDMHRFWNEQYVLQAFLTYNAAFEVIWAGYYMHLKHPGKLESAFGSYRRRGSDDWPVSFWTRKVA